MTPLFDFLSHFVYHFDRKGKECLFSIEIIYVED